MHTRFTIAINNSESFASIELADTLSCTSAQVFSFGAILNNFSIKKDNSVFNVVDGYVDVADAVAQKNTWFKGCRLSPFVCRLREGKYKWNNIDYRIEKFYLGKNAIHGLVYDAVYDIVLAEANNDFAILELQHSYTATDQGYPFTYTSKVIYKLEANNKLTITSSILHNHKTAIPYCEGWHPYFKLDEPIDNCYLQADVNSELQFDENMIPTGNLEHNKTFNNLVLLDNMQLDNCYKFDEINEPKCFLKSKNLILTITAKKNYPFLQIFIPDHRNNIAIECLSAAPDAFNNKIGLTFAEPNKEYFFELRYSLQ